MTCRNLFSVSKGNSYQILLSEMSLPGVEVLIEKLLPKILGRLGKENLLKDDAKLPFYSASVLCRRQFQHDFCTLHTTSQVKISVCMQGSCGYCPVCESIPKLFVRVPTAVQYSTKCCMTSHNTSTGLLGTFQASNIGEWYIENFSGVALSY